MQRQKSWVDEANELIHIADVLTSLKVYVPEGIRNGGNKKVYCPFGFYHSDRGTTKAMRVYAASNTAFCFSCSKRYSPVSLAAAAWDCSWQSAAFRLLEDIGYKPKTLQERWDEAIVPVYVKPDTDALAEALKMYCSGISKNWSELQLQDSVAVKFNKCLNLLNCVKTDEDAINWLTKCKIIMKNLLEEN